MLCFLAGFSVVTRHSVAVKSASADRATRLSATYQDARHWVGEQKSVERQYRIEGSYAVVAAHRQAERRLIADLDHVLALDSSPATRATVARLLRLQADYHSASQALFNAVDENDHERVLWFDHSAVDPVFGVLADVIYRQAAAASASALAHSAALRGDEVRANRTIAIAVLLALLLVAFFGAVVVRYGRRLDAAVAAEVERLAEMAITDPLTGLRNHRAFHEDVARELQRAGRTGVPLALVLLDLDDLKAVNDTQGHQAGDERLQALADAIRATGRGVDVAYRVGGDEFAVILPDARSWGALEFAQRLRGATQAGTHGAGPFTATAGISEALTLRSKDEFVREADLALIGAKRIHQDVVIYGPDLAPSADRGADEDEHHTRTLASALARAVDAKDSYTRSHCQTVSQLCGLIGAELGFDTGRLTRLRLAGLLHDVGKIGVPDAILNKPAKLTDARVRADEAPCAAGLRHRARGRHGGRGALGAPPPRALRRRRLSRRPRRRGHPAGVARHPGGRRLRGDDVGPALSPGAGPVLRDRRARRATPARSSIRPSSRPSPACSRAPARSGTCPPRRPPRPDGQRRRRRAVAGVGGRYDPRRGAHGTQLLELVAQRGLPRVVEGAALRAVLIEVAEDEVGNAGFAHWYGHVYPWNFFGTLISPILGAKSATCEVRTSPRRSWSGRRSRRSRVGIRICALVAATFPSPTRTRCCSPTTRSRRPISPPTTATRRRGWCRS